MIKHEAAWRSDAAATLPGAIVPVEIIKEECVGCASHDDAMVIGTGLSHCRSGEGRVVLVKFGGYALFDQTKGINQHQIHSVLYA